jgi:hypothetical protein
MAVATQTVPSLIAELNDLLQLDHDAVHAYTLAIKELEHSGYQRTIRRFRGDHLRHITQLQHLIEDYGGIPVNLPHLPTGAFKLAVQAAGAAGGDRAVLLAFKANERQVRDKYRVAAEGRHPADVSEVLHRAAEDEARHYAWALETLEESGAGEDTVAGRAAAMLEGPHAATATAIESAERAAMAGAERVRRAWRRRQPLSPFAIGGAVVVVLAGVGAVAALRSARRTRTS